MQSDILFSSIAHPVVIFLALTLKNHLDITLDQLLADATTVAGIYGGHLREFWLNLQEHPQLAAAFKKVVTSTSWVQLDPMSVYQLQSMGLVKLSGNEVAPRCQKYRQYFSLALGEYLNLPELSEFTGILRLLILTELFSSVREHTCN